MGRYWPVRATPRFSTWQPAMLARQAGFGQERTCDKLTAFVFKGGWMRLFDEHTEVPVPKDLENEGPIPSVWRPTLRSIVDTFVRHDYRLADGVSGVAPVSEETATQIRTYIKSTVRSWFHSHKNRGPRRCVSGWAITGTP